MTYCKKIFEFVKKIFFCRINNFSKFNEHKFVELYSMNNQECKVRPQIVNVNSDEPVIFPFSIKTSKYSGNCNNINDPYAKICVADVKKNLTVKVFNLMLGTNETRHIEWHETCRTDASVCNKKQHWNDDKSWCEYKELIDKGVCDKGFVWSPSNCECECDKSCNVGEYLYHENCKCRKKKVYKLVEECAEAAEEVKLAKITLSEDKNKHKCGPCTLYVLFSILFTINVGIGTYFVYFHWYLKKMFHVLSLVPVRKQQFIKFSFYWTYNWEKLNKLTSKIELFIFTTT